MMKKLAAVFSLFRQSMVDFSDAVKGVCPTAVLVDENSRQNLV